MRSRPHPPIQPDEEPVLASLDAAVTLGRDRAAMLAAAAASVEEPHDWPSHIAAAEHQPLIWDFLDAVIRDRRERGLAIEGPLLEWVLDRRPRQGGKYGPQPFNLLARNVAIVETVKAIVRKDHRPATTSKGGGSACHLVAERIGMSYRQVTRIWGDRKT